MLGCIFWGAGVGAAGLDASFREQILGCRYGGQMLRGRCWDADVGVPMLGCSFWGADVGGAGDGAHKGVPM